MNEDTFYCILSHLCVFHSIIIFHIFVFGSLYSGFFFLFLPFFVKDEEIGVRYHSIVFLLL